ncbi:hypothetical protein CAMRE0001_2150 [Campylobacter rectus RM3267]|uniref:Uncharacterized protein n=1 Tax=Campylobacter rectus RM3267 TaxID=553218 RepID=B9D454_CAMRE|nr:hypothetical protein CAMRE0001_2150 [Campylobacter rectus RM3267]
MLKIKSKSARRRSNGADFATNLPPIKKSEFCVPKQICAD